MVSALITSCAEKNFPIIFNTLKEKDGIVEINFKSDELEDVLKSHESDEFELNRKESVGYTGFNLEGDLSFFGQQEMTIKGRDISAKGKSVNLNSRWELAADIPQNK